MGACASQGSLWSLGERMPKTSELKVWRRLSTRRQRRKSKRSARDGMLAEMVTHTSAGMVRSRETDKRAVVPMISESKSVRVWLDTHAL